MVVFEIVTHDFPHRHRQPTLPEFATWVLRELLVYGFAETDRRESVGFKNRLDLLVLANHAPVGQPVVLGKFRELRASAI